MFEETISPSCPWSYGGQIDWRLSTPLQMFWSTSPNLLPEHHGYQERNHNRRPLPSMEELRHSELCRPQQAPKSCQTIEDPVKIRAHFSVSDRLLLTLATARALSCLS